MLEIFIDTLRNSILITGLVTVMMMMIESLNIESGGLIFKGLKNTKVGQVIIGALLGSVPGCMGGFATVSLYTHGLFSFGALVAMMIASSGDEAFVMLAMVPDKALMVMTVLFVIAVVVGIVTDFVGGRLHRKHCSNKEHSECGSHKSDCSEGFSIHEGDEHHEKEHKQRHFDWKRIVLLLGLGLFIAALASGHLGHEHAEGIHAHAECCHDHGHGQIDLLSEDWMNILFAGLSVIMLFALMFSSDHFIHEHIWKHIVCRHVPSIFAWTFGVLLVIGFGMEYIDLGKWVSGNTALMILLAAAVGIIPESGPNLIFITLYASGLVPFPVLLASCISQDGHASIPLLADSKKSFAGAKLINFAVALVAGYTAMLFI